MTKELKAALIRNHGAQFHRVAAMRIPEFTVTGVVQGKQTLDHVTRRNRADGLAVSIQRLFPSEGLGDE